MHFAKSDTSDPKVLTSLTHFSKPLFRTILLIYIFISEASVHPDKQ